MAYTKLPDENLLSRRPWYLAGAALIVLSLLVRQPLLVVAGLLIVMLGGIPELWYRYCLRGVRTWRTFSTSRAQIGEEIQLSLTLENRKLLPLPWIEVRDEAPQEGVLVRGAHVEPSTKMERVHLVNALSLWLMQRVTRRYRVRCVRRGIYTFGPMQIESGDPFGLLTREQRVEDTQHLLVYPLMLPLEAFGLPARAPFGEHAAPRALLEDPLRVAGVRDYVPGDDPRRIHWKATARTGTLQSRVFQPSTRHTLALFLDLRTYENPQFGYDGDLLELAISAAVSVSAWGLDQGYAVGLYANGSLAAIDQASSHHAASVTRAHRQSSALFRLRLPPSTDRDQVVRISEGLARLVPYFPATLATTLAREEHRLPYGSTVIYLGAAAALDAQTLTVLRRMRSRGHAVVVLLTGDTPLAVDDLPITRIGTQETWRLLSTQALAERGIDARGRALPGGPTGAGVPPVVLEVRG